MVHVSWAFDGRSVNLDFLYRDLLSKHFSIEFRMKFASSVQLSEGLEKLLTINFRFPSPFLTIVVASTSTSVPTYKKVLTGFPRRNQGCAS